MNVVVPVPAVCVNEPTFTAAFAVTSMTVEIVSEASSVVPTASSKRMSPMLAERVSPSVNAVSASSVFVKRISPVEEVIVTEFVRTTASSN